MFSRISAKRWMGSLEGTNCLSLDVLLHPRFQGTLFDKLDAVQPNNCEIRASIPITSSSEMRRASSKAASKSTSEPERSSPRAVEPNSDRRIIPAAFNSDSCPRSIAITCARSMFSLSRYIRLRSTAQSDCPTSSSAVNKGPFARSTAGRNDLTAEVACRPAPSQSSAFEMNREGRCDRPHNVLGLKALPAVKCKGTSSSKNRLTSRICS